MARIGRFGVPGLPHRVTQRGNRRERGSSPTRTTGSTAIGFARPARDRRRVELLPDAQPRPSHPHARDARGLAGRSRFWIRLAEGGTVSTTSSCRKSETGLGSSHEQSCASARQDRSRPSRRRRLARAKGREIFLPPKIPRNPLKRLISDEGIQGNPSFSNPHKRGLSRPAGRRPRKAKSAGRWAGGRGG